MCYFKTTLHSSSVVSFEEDSQRRISRSFIAIYPRNIDDGHQVNSVYRDLREALDSINRVVLIRRASRASVIAWTQLLATSEIVTLS